MMITYTLRFLGRKGLWAAAFVGMTATASDGWAQPRVFGPSGEEILKRGPDNPPTPRIEEPAIDYPKTAINLSSPDAMPVLRIKDRMEETVKLIQRLQAMKNRNEGDQRFVNEMLDKTKATLRRDLQDYTDGMKNAFHKTNILDQKRSINEAWRRHYDWYASVANAQSRLELPRKSPTLPTVPPLPDPTIEPEGEESTSDPDPAEEQDAPRLPIVNPFRDRQPNEPFRR